MRTTALTGPRGRSHSSRWSLSLALKLAGNWWTRTLKDWFAALGHDGARRLRCSSRSRRRCVNGPRPGLRNDQATRRRSGPLRRHRLRGGRRHLRRGRCNLSARRIDFCQGRSRGFHSRRFHSRLRNCRLRLKGGGNLHFDLGFCRLGCFFDRRPNDCRRRRLGRNHHCGRWTRDRLRSDEARCGLRWLNRGDWRCAGSCGRRFGDGAWRTRRHCGRRSHAHARRHGGNRGDGPRRSGGLRGFLRDRLQHVSRLGDVREIDLGLELFRMRARGPTGTAAGLAVLGIVLLDALRLVHFDGAGVRLLFSDSDLDQ